jgi:uncharacterized membrane protein
MPDGTTITEEHLHAERHAVETIIGGTIGGGVIAIAGIVLSIIGLAGVYPRWLLAAATIAVGVAFLIEGSTIASRLADLLHEHTEGRVQMAELGTGTTAETLAGLVGITLGIIGALNVAPAALLPIAAIVYGAAALLGSGTNVSLTRLLAMHKEESARAHQVMRQAVYATTGLQLLVGVGAIALGIIGLASNYPFTLSLVAMLAISGAFLLSNTAIASKMATALRREY